MPDTNRPFSIQQVTLNSQYWHIVLVKGNGVADGTNSHSVTIPACFDRAKAVEIFESSLVGQQSKCTNLDDLSDMMEHAWRDFVKKTTRDLSSEVATYTDADS